MYISPKAFIRDWDAQTYAGSHAFWTFVDNVLKDRIVTHIFFVLLKDRGHDNETRLRASVLLTQVAQACIAARHDKECITSQVKYWTPIYGDKTINELVEILELWRFLD
jgi:hypothetical protein